MRQYAVVYAIPKSERKEEEEQEVLLTAYNK